MSCSSCHAPEAGFTYPDSEENAEAGPVEGAVTGRFGFRKPPSMAYSALLQQGPPQFNSTLQAYAGGLFWDGRAANAVAQAAGPLVNPNEMNNLLHNVADPELVVEQIASGPYAHQFESVYGDGVFLESADTVFEYVCEALAAYRTVLAGRRIFIEVRRLAGRPCPVDRL